MEEQIIKYRILDFTEYPGPRYKHQGAHSGELFFQEILLPKFKEIQDELQKGKSVKLEVELDNTAGYASSFLDEAFGNLTYEFGEKFVKDHLEIISKEEPDWIQIIFNETIPEWERKRKRGVERKPDSAQQ